MFSIGMRAQSIESNRAHADQLEKRAYDFFVSAGYDSSLACYEKAENLYANAADWTDALQCLNREADVLVRLAQYEKALACLERAKEVAADRLPPDDPKLGTTYSLLGYVYHYKQAYNEAIRYLEEGLRIRLSASGPMNIEVGHSYYLLATTYRAMGKYDEAQLAITQALELSGKLGTQEDVAMSMLALANILSDKGEYAGSINIERITEETLVKLGKRASDQLAKCYFYHGRDLLQENQYKSAASYFSRSLSIYTGLYGEIHPTVSACLMKLGEVYSLQGDFEEARSYFTRSAEVLLKINGPNHSSLAELYAYLSDFYLRKHDLDSALSFGQKSVRIQRFNYGGLHISTANSLEKLARVFERKGEYDAALSTLDSSLVIKMAINPGSVEVARLYLSIAVVHSKSGHAGKADFYFRQAREVFDGSHSTDTTFLALLQNSYGDMFLRKKDFLSALDHYKEAALFLQGGSGKRMFTSPAREELSSSDELRLHNLLSASRVYESLDSVSGNFRYLDSAYTCLENAMSVQTMIRRGYRAEGSKIYFGEESYDLNKNAVEDALALHSRTKDKKYLQKAFQCSENSKASLLFDKMIQSEALHSSGAPESVLQREDLLRTNIASSTYKMGETDLHRSPKGQQSAYFTNLVAYDKLIDSLENYFPNYYDLKYRVKEVALPSIQERLPSTSVILEYFFAKDRLCIFTISKGKFNLTVTRRTSEIKEAALAMRKSLRTVDRSEYLKHASDLYKMIVQPVEKFLRGKQLIVIPDGELYYIPFEALLTAPQSSKTFSKYSSLPFLIKTHTVSYAYSASLFMERRETPSQTEKSFVGFAPVFDDSTTKNLGETSKKDFAELRSFSLDGKKYGDLEYSQEEVADIATLFKKSHLKSKTFLHHEASESNFKQTIQDYSFVHIASHGFADEAHPDLSALLFSEASGSQTREDGILNATETYDLKLNADLVVLSSCESGIGRLVKGEGLMAITRGFFCSGARNVLFSLWKISDKSTSKLMVDFYRSVLAGGSFPHALQQAKLNVIRDNQYAFPNEWAGFLLISSN
jgi:CHAT domain-containing protein/tetratricopeptide (TPR) repeat protein